MKTRRFVLAAFGGVLVSCWAGCSSGAPGGGAADVAVVGTFALVKVDGVAVPADTTHGETALRVESGVFEIGADGTCQSTVVFAAAGHAPVTRVVRAVYTRDGGTLTMKWEGAGTTVGTVRGDVFTMDNHGTVFEYERGVGEGG